MPLATRTNNEPKAKRAKNVAAVPTPQTNTRQSNRRKSNTKQNDLNKTLNENEEPKTIHQNHHHNNNNNKNNKKDDDDDVDEEEKILDNKNDELTESEIDEKSIQNTQDVSMNDLDHEQHTNTEKKDDKNKVDQAKTDDEIKNNPTKLNNTASNMTVNTTHNSSTNNTTSITVNEDTIMTDASSLTNLTESSKKNGEIVVHIKREYKSGFALSVGENLSNQLGLGGDIDNRKKPQIIKELPENIVQIAAGGMHSAGLTEDGIVYTFGCNDEFALGRDNEDEIDKVELPEKIIEITAGDSHTAALSEDGVVYAWGTFRDGSGVLGLEQKKIAKKPMRFKLREKVAKISSGADHLVFLTVTGDVYTAGNSEHGQLGRISKYNSCRGGRRGADLILVPGQVRITKKKELHGNKKVENIWTSAYCTFLQIKDSDVIVGFGLNNCYQLGIEDCENRYQPEILSRLKFDAKLKKVIGGMHHTLFLDENGSVYSLGSHRYGGLGIGKVDADVTCPLKIENLPDIIDIAASTNVSYAINKTGKVFSWGTNYSKQLGQDTEDDYFVPTLVNSKQFDVRNVYCVSVGGQHTLFVASEENDESDSD